MKKKKKCVKYCCYYFIFINTKNITQPQISAIPARSPSRVPFRVVRSCIFFSFCPASFLCTLQREMQMRILENQVFFLFIRFFVIIYFCFVLFSNFSLFSVFHVFRVIWISIYYRSTSELDRKTSHVPQCYAQYVLNLTLTQAVWKLVWKYTSFLSLTRFITFYNTQETLEKGTQKALYMVDAKYFMAAERNGYNGQIFEALKNRFPEIPEQVISQTLQAEVSRISNVTLVTCLRDFLITYITDSASSVFRSDTAVLYQHVLILWWFPWVVHWRCCPVNIACFRVCQHNDSQVCFKFCFIAIKASISSIVYSF